MNVIKTISTVCKKHTSCIDCEFCQTEEGCSFVCSPWVWDTDKICKALDKMGYISDSVEVLNGLIKRLEALEDEVEILDPDAVALYDIVMNIVNNCLKVG